MKNGKMKPLLISLLVLAAVFLTAGTVSAATVLQTDKTTADSGCVMLGIRGSYIANPQGVLDRINAIRLEACQEGVVNPSTGSKLTVSDYVPIKWSSDLEYIARIRAAESSLTMNHIRTNGTSCFAIAGPNGVRSYGEVIAWNWSDSAVMGIEQWYEEKYDWVNNTGNVTGHYTQMIDPANKYVGLGTFCTDSAGYYNTTVGEFTSYASGLDETGGTSVKDCIQILEIKADSIKYSLTGPTSGKAGDVEELELTASVSNSLYSAEGLVVTDSVTWESSDSAVASVSAEGILTVNSCGSTVITAKTSSVSSTLSYTAEHTVVTDAAVAATCTGTGKTAGSHCSVCGEVLTAQKIIPQTNHSWKTVMFIQKSSGTKKTETCSICGEKRTTSLSAAARKKVPVKNSLYQYGQLVYKITKSARKNGTVSVKKLASSSVTSLKIPATVKLQGYTFQVTAIEKNAFSGNKNLKKVIIGKNVVKIGSKAFYKNSNLKYVAILSKKPSSIGKNAFSGISNKAVIHVPKQNAAAQKYQKLLKNSGIGSKVKISADK